MSLSDSSDLRGENMNHGEGWGCGSSRNIKMLKGWSFPGRPYKCRPKGQEHTRQEPTRKEPTGLRTCSFIIHHIRQRVRWQQVHSTSTCGRRRNPVAYTRKSRWSRTCECIRPLAWLSGVLPTRNFTYLLHHQQSTARRINKTRQN